MTHAAADFPVSANDIELAHQRIKRQIVRTPLVESKTLGQMINGRVFLKCENLQHTGSFKFRGGSNSILSLSADERANGVIAYSSGNHAQGVACAAKMAGTAATIVMPLDAPAIKVANTRGHGAKVVQYDRYTESREDIGDQIARETGAYLIKPYDDLRVIAGQGTCGLEIAQQCASHGITPDSVIVCAGGGGLAAGTGIAVKDSMPSTKMFAAEPHDFDDFGRSLTSGKHQTNDPAARSICDAIITPTPGKITFPIVQALFEGALSATDDQVRQAVKTLFETSRLVAEPGGAIAVASLMAHADKFQGQTVIATISGGNLDQDMLLECLAAQ